MLTAADKQDLGRSRGDNPYTIVNGRVYDLPTIVKKPEAKPKPEPKPKAKPKPKPKHEPNREPKYMMAEQHKGCIAQEKLAAEAKDLGNLD